MLVRSFLPTVFTAAISLAMLVVVSIHSPSACETSETHLRWSSGTNYSYYDEFFELRGIVAWVESSGDILVLATEEEVMTFRITAPGVLEELDTYSFSPWLNDMVYDGNQVYALINGTLHILDVDTAGNLSSLATLAGAGNRKIAKQGNYVYTTSGAGLRVIDVSAPATPTSVGFAPADAFRIVVQGDWAYVSDLNFSAWAVDISDPSNPTYDGGAFVGGAGQLRGLEILDSYLYVAKAASGLRVFELTTPGSPGEVGVLPGYASHLAADDGTLAANLGSGSGMGFVDTSDPSDPQYTGFFRTTGFEDMSVAHGFAYVAAGYDGLQILELRDEVNAAPVATASEFADPRAMATLPSTVLLGLTPSLEVVSVADPLNPVGIGSLAFNSIRSVAAAGSDAYVVDVDGFHVVDLTTPSSPSLVASIPEPDYGRIILTGSRAYVWNLNRIATVDVTDPANPALLAVTNPQEFIYGVAASGNDVYIMTSFELFSTVILWDYTDPTDPNFIEATSLDLAATIELAGDQIIAAGYEETTAFDAETLFTLDVIGDCSFGIDGMRWTEAGLFALNGSYHLFETQPELSYVSTGSTPQSAITDLAVLGDYLYAIDEGGLYVYDLPCATADLPEIFPVGQAVLRAVPNPSAAGVWVNLAIPGGTAGTGDSVLEIFDPRGRRVRSLGSSVIGEPVFWDGRDENGRAVPSGVFLARWSGGWGEATGRLHVVR